MVDSRRKGHDFERFISKYLQKFFPMSKRHLEYQFAESHTGVDVENTSPFAIQCKCYNNIAVYKWLEEIKQKDLIPILIAKANNKKPILIGYLDDIAELVFDSKFINLMKKKDN